LRARVAILGIVIVLGVFGAIRGVIPELGPKEAEHKLNGLEVRYTSRASTDLIEGHDTSISMDGRRRVQDSIFIEPLTRIVFTRPLTTEPRMRCTIVFLTRSRRLPYASQTTWR